MDFQIISFIYLNVKKTNKRRTSCPGCVKTTRRTIKRRIGTSGTRIRTTLWRYIHHLVKTLPTGLPMQITERFIEKVWDDEDPEAKTLDFVHGLIARNNWEVPAQLIQILVDFHLYNMVFAKSDLSLTNYQVLKFK